MAARLIPDKPDLSAPVAAEFFLAELSSGGSVTLATTVSLHPGLREFLTNFHDDAVNRAEYLETQLHTFASRTVDVTAVQEALGEAIYQWQRRRIISAQTRAWWKHAPTEERRHEKARRAVQQACEDVTALFAGWNEGSPHLASLRALLAELDAEHIAIQNSPRPQRSGQRGRAWPDFAPVYHKLKALGLEEPESQDLLQALGLFGKYPV